MKVETDLINLIKKYMKTLTTASDIRSVSTPICPGSVNGIPRPAFAI